MKLPKITGAFIQLKTYSKRAFSGYDNSLFSGLQINIFLGLAGDIGIYIRSAFSIIISRPILPFSFQPVIFIGLLFFLSAFISRYSSSGFISRALPILMATKSGLIELWLEDD